MDREKVISDLEQLEAYLHIKSYTDTVAEAFYRTVEDAVTLLKEHGQQIERLEHDLSVAENNFNYYVNGNN